jgi:hypothetical protein
MKASRALLFGCAGIVMMISSDVLAASQAAKVSPKDNPPMVRTAKVPGGDILLNQQPNAVNGFFNDSDCQLCGTGQQSIADNFVVNSPTGSVQLNQITIWGGYFPGNTPNATDDFDILIHNNAGGLPGPSIVFSVSGIPATSRAMTGIVLFGVDEWIFDFTLAAPPTLPNGTYWLEIFNNTAPTPGVDMFWETGNLDGTNGVANAAFATQTPGTAWNPNPGENAVVLTGVIPVTLQEFAIE